MIAPYQATGPEWIAVYGLTPSSSERILQWTFADAQGSVGKVSTSTPLLWDETTKTLRFELKSARLNNSGDSVYLKTPTGDTHDEYTYTEIDKDQRWVRESCSSPWYIWPQPVVQYTSSVVPPTSANITELATQSTPVEMNVQALHLPDAIPIVIEEEAPEIVPTSANTATTITNALSEQRPPPPTTTTDRPSITSNTYAVIELADPPQAVVTSPPIKPPPTSEANSLPSKASTAKAISTKVTAKKSAAKNATTSSAAKKTTRTIAPKPIISSVDMTQLIEDPAGFQGVRVRLTGFVASTPRLIAANAFVVLNSDGKGLLIQGKSSTPSPARGTYVELTGVFNWNDTGVILKQQTKDDWKEIVITKEPVPAELPLRLVSLEHPSQEDAWSHIEIEGRVAALQTSSLDLETDDGFAIHIKVPKALGYRPSRVQKGDTLRVRGLLDLRGNEPTLIPQILDDLQILERAPLPIAPERTGPSSPWLPAGIIAGTLSTGEGLRRLRTWRKKRLEQQAFESFLQGQSQTDA